MKVIEEEWMLIVAGSVRGYLMYQRGRPDECVTRTASKLCRRIPGVRVTK